MKNTNVEKKTQTQMFTEIREFLKNQEAANPEVREYINFLQDRIDLLVNQSIRAKERKQAKAKEKPEDELYAAVAAQLGENLKTREDIVAALEVEFPEVSPAKVTNRLTKLVNAGVAGKISVNVGEGRRVMAYALAEYMPTEDED